MRQELFDGEENFYYGKRYKVKDGQFRLSFREDDLETKNYLIELKNIISNDCFENLISTFNLKKADNRNFRSIENLEVYFIKKRNTIFLISAGEFQPSRFMMFYEGVYILKNSDFNK